MDRRGFHIDGVNALPAWPLAFGAAFIDHLAAELLEAERTCQGSELIDVRNVARADTPMLIQTKAEAGQGTFDSSQLS